MFEIPTNAQTRDAIKRAHTERGAFIRWLFGFK